MSFYDGGIASHASALSRAGALRRLLALFFYRSPAVERISVLRGSMLKKMRSIGRSDDGFDIEPVSASIH